MNSATAPGLRANWQQFALLVLVNAFVGGMVGIERSIFPQFAESEFGVTSKAAVLSFIMAFGLAKATANYLMGRLANRYGRRNLLIFGWLLALPIPWMLIYAQHWYLVVAANVLLGLSQGFAWSSTVVMKIDLVGEKDRGLAMGLNEFAGYLAVGIFAFLSGYLADQYGVTPYPFYLGVALSGLGLASTLIWVKDTSHFVGIKPTKQATEKHDVFRKTTFRDRTLSSVTQAGLVNNLNDGMIWGLLPVLLVSQQFDTTQIGVLAALYPVVWGIGQLFTGKMSDMVSKKGMLVWGMLLQGAAILVLPYLGSYLGLGMALATLGLGTALVYPTFLSAIADATAPSLRAETIGVFRLWRDLGYAIGALLSGIVADVFGVTYAILSIGALTLLSSLVIRLRMPSSRKGGAHN